MTKYTRPYFKPYRKSEETWDEYVARRDAWNQQMRDQHNADVLSRAAQLYPINSTVSA